jgi:hypothetical protein
MSSTRPATVKSPAGFPAGFPGGLKKRKKREKKGEKEKITKGKNERMEKKEKNNHPGLGNEHTE